MTLQYKSGIFEFPVLNTFVFLQGMNVYFTFDVTQVLEIYNTFKIFLKHES